MSVRSGRRKRISSSRSLPRDVLHFFLDSPTCPQDRVIEIGRVDELRRALPRPISLPLLFLKAFGIVAAKYPELRQFYRRWPWPHILENDQNVAMMVVQRQHRGEPWVLWARFLEPENQPLDELQAALDGYVKGPVEETYRRQLQLAGLPTPLRRMLWWWTLNVSRKRSKRLGTYFLTTLAGQGCTIQHPANFLNSLTYGPIENGRTRLTLAYDHRLMDGVLVARALKQTERVLNGTIREELERMLEEREIPLPEAA